MREVQGRGGKELLWEREGSTSSLGTLVCQHEECVSHVLFVHTAVLILVLDLNRFMTAYASGFLHPKVSLLSLA